MPVSNTIPLDNGLVGRRGLLSDAQFAEAARVIEDVATAGLESVRISFADQHGVLRGKTIVASGLASAFRNGIRITSTLLLKDTSNRTVFPVWGGDIGFGDGTLTGAGDVLIVPDPATFRILPWSNHSGWLLCDVYYSDGSVMPFCSRSILKTSMSRLAAANMAMLCGLEVEFCVYKVDQPRLAHSDGGMSATPPRDQPVVAWLSVSDRSALRHAGRGDGCTATGSARSAVAGAFDGSGVRTESV